MLSSWLFSRFGLCGQYPARSQITRLTDYDFYRVMEESKDPPEGVNPQLARIVRLVSDMFSAPIVAVCATEEARQRVRLCTGLTREQADQAATLCTHALSYRTLEVPDAFSDRRFRENSLVRGPPHVRFFAGADLRVPGNAPLGTLCVMDRQPRRLTQATCRQLQHCADLVAHELASPSSPTRRGEESTLPVYQQSGLPDGSSVEEQAQALLDRAGEADQGVAALSIRLRSLHDAMWIRSTESGQDLLQSIASRVVRHAPGDAVFARLPGPSFMVLLPVDVRVEAFMASISDMARQLSKPYYLGVGRVRTPCNIGVAFAYPKEGISAAMLMSRARRTVEHLCLEGDGPVGLHSEELDRSAFRHQEIAARIPTALTEQALSLVYQPIVSVRTGRILRVEALLRWHDRWLGHVSAEEILAVASEDPELSSALTHYVLETALRESRPWTTQGIQLHVNVSATELANPAITELVDSLIKESDFEPRSLTLELREENLLPDLERSKATFATLARRGVGLAIDGFGSGYASIRSLQGLPVRVLKINRSFIANVEEDRKSYHLVKGIVEVTGRLGINVIADGVDDAAQQRQLIELGCEEAQGYLFHVPLDAASVTRILDEQRTRV